MWNRRPEPGRRRTRRSASRKGWGSELAAALSGPGELAPPEVVAAFGEPMLAAQILDRHSRIGFPEKPYDLCFGESLLHRPTLRLGRTLNRHATQIGEDVRSVLRP